MTEQIGLEHAVDALQDGRHALQSHAGVDRGTRQRLALLLRHLLELHEHQVPELEEAIAVLLRAARRSAPDVLAAVDEDFGARPARPGVAHRPEIVRGRDPDDAVVREARDLLPVARRLVVVVIDGDEQLVLLQAEVFGDQRPGELDRAILEVVAEREVAEHLEEGEMPRGVADIVEVVVLAAGAHAFLRGGGALIGPLLDAGEDVLELHHAGIGEHQRRVVARHQRRGRHDFVAVVLEEVQKSRPDLVDAAHVHPIGGFPVLGLKTVPCSGGTLLDKPSRSVQKLCSEIMHLLQHAKAFENAGRRVDSLGAVVFSYLCSRQSRRERPAKMPAPKEQPPRKLSGKRTA